MEDLQAQMGAILNDPEMMKSIMTLAQSMSQPQQEPPAQPAPQMPEGHDNIDLGLLQQLSGFARQSNIDNNQRSLLKALGPYLNKERIAKLERAMRAARMARVAASFLGGLQLNPGR